MKKLFVITVALLLAFALSACTPPSDQPATTTPAGTNTEAPSSSAEPSASPEPSPVPYSFTTEDMAYPFWKSGIMRNEIITFQRGSDDSITAKLLFKPTAITCVKDNSLKITLKEGVHYAYDPANPKVLTWLPGDDEFVIPFFEKDDLTSAHQDSCGASGIIGNCMYCVGPWLYEKQLHITYTYDLSDFGAASSVASYAGDKLPKTISKLKNKEELNLVIYGDSIFTGGDSSAQWNREPFVPTFFNLLKDQLEALYGAKINMTNTSKGGEGAQWGVDNVEECVNAYQPDLVIIGFGMNDAQNNSLTERDLIKQITDAVSAKNPDCEFILVATFVANPAIGWDINQGAHYLGFKMLEETGVVAMDMHKLHEYILFRKYYQYTTGNNLNHPNDWLARMYAMQLLSILYDFDAQ